MQNNSDHLAGGAGGGVRARFYKTLGRFNLIGSGKNWQLVLVTSAGNASALFDEDDEPAIHGLLPSDVLDIIEERLKRSLQSDMAARRQVVAAIREQIESLDTAWLADQLALAESAYLRAKKRYEAQISSVNEVPA